MAGNNNMMIIGAIVVIVVIVIIAALLLSTPSTTTTASTVSVAPTSLVTTSTPVVTTATIPSITTTIVANQTVAVAPNLVPCNGYNFSVSQPNQVITSGSCVWTPLRNQDDLTVTIGGGAYSGVSLALVQQNVTSAPANMSVSAASCATGVQTQYMPPGNYKLTFTTGAVNSTSCGAATFRITH